MTTGTNQILWWGYRHINGTLQAKRYFDARDLGEARSSDFVREVCGPFEAHGREDALKKIAAAIGS